MMTKKNENVLDISKTTAEAAETSTVKEAFSAWMDVFKALFGKQKDNEVLRDLGIKKGVKSGFKYMLWFTFIIPAKIFSFLLAPRWEYLQFLERSILTPIFEMEFVSGSRSPSEMTGAVYEKYLNYLSVTQKTGVEDPSLKPETATIERIVAFAKFRTILSMLIVAMGAMLMYDAMDILTDLISEILGLIVGIFLYLSIDLIGLGLSVWFAAKIITYFLIAYLIMFFVAFMVEAFRNVAFTRREMVLNFIDDSVNYTVAKSIENFGEDVAYQAYELLIENLVIKRDVKRYDVYSYEALIEWKDRKLLKETAFREAEVEEK